MLGVIIVQFCREHELDEYLKTYHQEYFYSKAMNPYAKEDHITVRSSEELKFFLSVPLIQDKGFQTRSRYVTCIRSSSHHGSRTRGPRDDGFRQGY